MYQTDRELLTISSLQIGQARGEPLLPAAAALDIDEFPFSNITLDARSWVSNETCEVDPWEFKEILLAVGERTLDWSLGGTAGGVRVKDLPLPNTLPPPKVLGGIFYWEDGSTQSCMDMLECRCLNSRFVQLVLPSVLAYRFPTTGGSATRPADSWSWRFGGGKFS